ncbi:hypothetical protein [Mesorhizobium sp. B2-4-19]|uniref:hypothetical protein n=1 Tax=Mesorhizobium sp. B2-4-19 TaxID=2589930 RepID=UPI0015E44F92|nr:hypothetical protein [Mesorhizobium sp. B2-4-19]
MLAKADGQSTAAGLAQAPENFARTEILRPKIASGIDLPMKPLPERVADPRAQ